MQFGIGVSTHINNWDIIRYAEELGYDRAWVGDSQMIWSDCYATMALAAHHTSRIQIGMTWPPHRANTRSTPRALRKRAISAAVQVSVMASAGIAGSFGLATAIITF